MSRCASAICADVIKTATNAWVLTAFVGGMGAAAFFNENRRSVTSITALLGESA